MWLRDIIGAKKMTPQGANSLNNQLIYYSKGSGFVDDLLIEIDNIFELEIKKPVPKADPLKWYDNLIISKVFPIDNYSSSSLNNRKDIHACFSPDYPLL